MARWECLSNVQRTAGITRPEPLPDQTFLQARLISTTA
jgi:hypothetical protein